MKPDRDVAGRLFALFLILVVAFATGYWGGYGQGLRVQQARAIEAGAAEYKVDHEAVVTFHYKGTK